MTVIPSEGVSFVKSSSKLVRKFVCVEKQSSKTVNISLQFNDIGRHNIRGILTLNDFSLYKTLLLSFLNFPVFF